MGLLKKFSSIVPLCLAATPVLAGSVTGSLSVFSGESDNATKTKRETIDERQNEYQLSLIADYEAPLVEANASYLVSERRFAEESQTDESYLDGKSSLYIGAETLPADLLIKHSRRILLQNPDQLQTTDNLDERDILSVTPTVRSAISNVDMMALSADYTRVSFAENELRDSERQGGSLQWIHALSNVDNLRLVGQHLAIEFKALPQADYTYQNAYLAYTANLRSLTYSLLAGYNQSENDISGKVDSPSYAVNASYQKGAHEIELMLMQQITDTSFGDGNTNPVDSIPGSDGAAEVYQLKRLVTEVRWTSTLLCARCSSYLMFRNMEDDYITIDEVGIQTTTSAGFSYQFSKDAQLVLSSENSRRRFEESIVSNSYELNRIRIGFNYQFSNHLRMKLIAWREDREKNETFEGYTENYTGMGLTYQF